MKKKWLVAITATALVASPLSFQTVDASSENESAQTSELPPELEPILNVAPEHQPTLQQGSTGMEVKFVQVTLNQSGFKTEVDGLFGAQTDKQVRQFQSKHGLAADGIVGVKTWTAIFNEYQEVRFSVEKAITYAEEALDNDDLVFSSDGVLHKDSDGKVFYSLKAQSQDLIEGGGTGTVGFYDVYQSGDVVESKPR
ncbi:peptidoglycan-binding domain-containing protein [Priestia megaterium]|uniref:peptidoglycan-binding domain-containing protein n=1 Tax=Priestia megaterium TaxID=1404 RepID=UPI001D5298F4|nr:peptidoglycan-binding domain-containing protein [Priestia megaterium]CAH0313056.1 Zinc D-Ala-D-Ala carboxypeptidase [Priestia megaterium]